MRVVFVSDQVNSFPPSAVSYQPEWMRCSFNQPIPESDLYIWDFQPGAVLVNEVNLRLNSQHLLLVEITDLVEIEQLRHLACVLLKPLSGFTLRAFVELALKTWQVNQQIREAETLKQDRDTLLQYVLEVNLKLQEFDHKRNNFLARALHDFRSPLTALYGYCGLLAQGKLGEVSSQQRELLIRMSKSTSRLAGLAGSTLDLLLQARLDRPIAKQNANLRDTFYQAVHDVAPLLEEKYLDLRVDLVASNHNLVFASEQIQQVFINLLENSCRFTPRQGWIEVKGYPVLQALNPDLATRFELADAYRIDICDSGPGIPKEHSERIFEEYASYAGPSDRSGGGLGLSICRNIIAAHRGTIWTTPSERGARFSFILPLHISKSPLVGNPAQSTPQPQLEFDTAGRI